MLRHRWYVVALLLAGCSSPHQGNGPLDLAVGVDAGAPPDLSVPADLATPPDAEPSPDLITSSLPGGAFGVWLLDGDATDSSGNGNNGTLQGTLTTVANRHGVAGKALSFDGATEISFASTTPYFSSALSVSFWIKVVTGASTDNGWPISECNSSNGSPFSFAVSNNNLWLTSGGSSTGLDTFSGGDTGWVHVVLVWDISGATITPYINGIKGSSTSFPRVSTSGTNLLFGRRGTLAYYNGYLDDVRMYDRLLTSDEVAALYAE